MNIGANLRFFLNFGRWDPDFRSSADEKRLQKARAQMPAVAAVHGKATNRVLSFCMWNTLDVPSEEPYVRRTTTAHFPFAFLLFPT